MIIRLRPGLLLCCLWLLVCSSVAQGPAVNIATSPNQQITLSWSDGAGSFALESAVVLSNHVAWSALNAAPIAQNGRKTVTIGATSRQQYFRLRGEAGAALTTILETSPINGESGVSVNRETIVRFSAPLPASAKVDSETFYAQFGGRKLLGRAEISSDRRTATLFHQEPLPAGARIQALFTGAANSGASEAPIDADGDGQAGGTAVISFDTMSTAALAGTAVIGRVYDSAPISSGNGPANRPVQGAIITIDGAEQTLRSTTDKNGFFKLEPCPSGRFFVHIDGRPAVGSSWPKGAYYPVVGKTFEAILGKTNNLAGGSGEIYLPLIQAGTLQEVSATQPTTITFPPTVLANNPDLNGVSVTVPANDLFSDNGTRGGRVGIAPVPPDRIPSPLPAGLSFPLVITIQTDGPSNFDTPVPVKFLNLPDPITHQKLGPGEKTWLWSFNHDTGRWEPQGTMTISADGLFALTDPGVGVKQPGWHGVNPGSPAKYPASPVTRFRKPCVPVTLEEIKGNAQQDLDCFGKAIPFFDAVKSLLGAASSIEDLVSSLQTLVSGGPIETLQAACNTFFTVKGLAGQAAEGLSLKANELAVADILNCELHSLENTLLVSCKVSSCLSQNDSGTVCQQMVDMISTVENLYEQARGFSNDPKGFTQGKLQAGVQAYCASLTGAQPGRVRPLASVLQPTLNEALRLQRVLNEFKPMAAGIDKLLSLDRALVEELHSPIWAQFVGYQNAYYRLSFGSVELRGRSSSLGNFELPLLPPNTDYTFEVYDPLLNLVAVSKGISAAGGRTTAIPDPILQLVGVTDLSGDTDNDGLTDLAEKVIGTRTDLADSDSDGINDLAEVQQGLDPLSGLSLPAGIIATVSLPGEAYGVRQSAGKAYVATGSHGLAIVDISRIDAPVLQGQLDLPGLNVTLALSEANKIAAVVAFPALVIGNDFALHFVDVSDANNPRLIRSLNIAAQDVKEADGLFFVALDKEIRILDPVTSMELGWLPLTNKVSGMTISSGRLYVATEKGLEIYEVALPAPHFLGSVETDFGLLKTTFRSGDIVVDGSILHGGSGNGYVTMDVSDPARPKALGRSTNSFPPIVHSLALNGSGRMISLISFSGSNRDVAVFDSRNPANVDAFLGSFDTRATSRDHDLVSGIAIVADYTAGLTFVNTSGFDANGKPPQVTLDLSSLDEDPGKPGIQIGAGRTVPVHATVLDDVQLREARLLVNGQPAETLKEGPILFSLELPGAMTNGSRVTIEVEALDTGGNRGTSGPQTIELLADTSPLTLLASVPRDGAGAFATSGFVFRFDEPVILGVGSVALRSAGPDGIIGNADDTDVSLESVQAIGSTLRVFPTNTLAAGAYQIRIPASLVADRSSNHLAEDFVANFTAFAANPDAAIWISKTDGQFENPTNWLNRHVPGLENVLLPDGIGQPTVRITTKKELLRLESHLPLRFDTGASVLVDKEWMGTAPVVISNATVFIKSSSTLDGSMQISGGQLGFTAPATFNGPVTVERAGTLSFSGPTAKAEFKGGLSAVNFSVTVDAGAKIDLPQLQNYDGPGDFTGFLAAGTRFQADGAGSKITLSELISANGPTNWNVRAVPSVRFVCFGGGTIELPKLMTLTGRTSFSVTDPGSKINAPSLANVTGPVSEFLSSVNVSGRAEIVFGTNIVFTRCNLALAAPATMGGGDVEIGAGSSLEGTGTINANLINRGMVTLDGDPDALLINGNLDLRSESILNVTLGLGGAKTNAGHFDLRGSVALNCLLKLTVPRGTVLAAGQEFRIATFAQPPSGSFTQIDSSALALRADALQTPQDFKLRLAP